MSLEIKKVNIIVDGKSYSAGMHKNLLDACLTAGLYIPHFCYHPALGSVGACRLCAVKKFADVNDTGGKIIMSCMEPVREGMIISIEDPEVRQFRKAVIESLMINHPHDCPVCDEGGECHLQDMTIMTGHNYRRYEFRKRTYRDQYLGPFIQHEMNRCIQCYRCIRYYRDYAGGKDLNVFASRDHVYFGRHTGGTLENEFSGNLVEVCPTGVFTDKTLKKHFTRKWDLTNAPSVCVHCSVGCNILVSERYNKLRRVMNRYNGRVNGYFICDRGRFGYEFVNDEKSLRSVRFRTERNGIQEETGTDAATEALGKMITREGRIAGIGSPRASLEANYALLSFVGEENFFHGISGKEQFLTGRILDILRTGGIKIPSIKEIEKADCILILGEDLTNTAPRVALAVRQASMNLTKAEAAGKGIPLWNDAPVRELAQNGKTPLFIATSVPDRLDEISTGIFRAGPDKITELGSCIARILGDRTAEQPCPPGEIWGLAERIAVELKKAAHPLIISGVSSGDAGIVNASMKIALALLQKGSACMLSMVLPECNSMGLAMLPGKPLREATAAARSSGIDTLIVLENDLYRRDHQGNMDDLMNGSRHVVVLDHYLNRTGLKGDLVLPVSTFAGSVGTIVNQEGRAQRYYSVLPDTDGLRESWRWISYFGSLRDPGRRSGWNDSDELLKELADEIPLFSDIAGSIPGKDFRMLNAKIPRQTHRFSGRTSNLAHISVSEPKLHDDPDSPLSFSMEGLNENPPASLVPFYWMPGWNSVQAFYDYLDEPNGPLRGGDPGVTLIKPALESRDFRIIPEPTRAEPSKDDWLLVPVYKLFGSEELSSKSLTIKQIIGDPFILMNRNDARDEGFSEKDPVIVETGGERYTLRLKIEDYIPGRTAGISVNFPELAYMDLPATGRLFKQKQG